MWISVGPDANDVCGSWCGWCLWVVVWTMSVGPDADDICGSWGLQLQQWEGLWLDTASVDFLETYISFLKSGLLTPWLLLFIPLLDFDSLRQMMRRDAPESLHQMLQCARSPQRWHLWGDKPPCQAWLHTCTIGWALVFCIAEVMSVLTGLGIPQIVHSAYWCFLLFVAYSSVFFFWSTHLHSVFPWSLERRVDLNPIVFPT